MFFLLIALGIAIPTSNFFTIDNLTKTISEIPIDKIINNDSEEPKIYTYLSKAGLSKERIYTFLDKNGFKNILGENLGSKVLNKINSFEIKTPSEDQITDFIYENLEYVKRIFLFSTTRDDVYEIVHKNYSFIEDLIEDVSDKIDLSGFENLKLIAKLFRKASVYIIEIAIVICILFLVIFRASLYKWLMWVYAATMPVAILFITIGALGNNLIYNIVTKLKFLFLVEPFVEFFTNSMIKYGVILLIISILSLLSHFIIKKIKNNKKKEDKEIDKKLELALK